MSMPTYQIMVINLTLRLVVDHKMNILWDKLFVTMNLKFLYGVSVLNFAVYKLYCNLIKNYQRIYQSLLLVYSHIYSGLIILKHDVTQC